MTDGSLELECAGEWLRLTPERALVWPVQRTAFIADFHLGKAEVFRRSGIAIPDGATRADLRRLDALIASHALQRIVLLGDFLHAASPHASTYGEEFARWRSAHGALDFVVVAGNHDRKAAGRELTEVVEWHLHDLKVGPFICRHYPQRSQAGYVLCGHLHPVMRIYGSHRERARVPVCWMRQDYAVLPSFGSFTGGAEIDPAASDRVFAFAAGRVWRMPSIR